MTDFLTRGPMEETSPKHVLVGIKFVSTGPIEFIGEIVDVVDAVAFIKSPILLGRDVANISRFNLVPFHKANPIVANDIQVPLAAISFLCRPSEQFIKNYLAAKSGLVTAVSVGGIGGGTK